MELMREHSTPPAALALETVREWILWVTEVERRIGPHFARRDLRRRARAYLRGLLSPVERKHSGQLAEVTGAATPYGVQHLLGRATWDAEAVRAELPRYLLDHLEDPQAVLGIDETGLLTKGRHSVGVARQYSGTAGRIENSQIGVFLAYAGAQGHALLDRALSLPKEWTNARQRCQQAGVPAARAFLTKPALAQQRLARALTAGVPAAWVPGASVYGDDRRLRRWLEASPHAYVLAVSGKAYVWLGWQQRQVQTVLAALPADGWPRLSAGAGAKGLRWYAWRWLPLAPPRPPAWRRWLLVRRSLSDPTELTAFVVFAPQTTTLAEAVHVAGTRWTIESCCEAAKGEVGRDHSEVRSWTGWYRHITLAMWAYALLTVLRATHVPPDEAPQKTAGRSRPSSLAAVKTMRGLRSR